MTRLQLQFVALAAALVLTACPDDGPTGTADVPSDIAPDEKTDTGEDVTPDADATPDVPDDTPDDTPDDGPPEDVPEETTPDADATEDTPSDADVPEDADPDSEPDADPDVPADEGSDGDALDDADADEDVPSDAPGDVPTDVEPDVEPDVPPPPPSYVSCDSGHEAWVMRTLPMLLGRPATGIQEVRVLATLAEKTSRREVALALMDQPGFAKRWQQWIMDELRINRVGSKEHSSCYGGPQVANHTGQIARFVRDNPAVGGGPGFSFNMTDLVLSSLALDDLSPIWRGHLFAMLSKPLTGANVDALELDITRRQDFGEIFEATYLHRNVVCAGCHNSLWGTTDAFTPTDIDKHWPLPGRSELALYGADSGIPEMDFYTAFRHLGVVGGPMSPWDISISCGTFNAEANITDDPAGYEVHFIKPRGLTANIWQVERALQIGFDKLRASGAVSIGPNGEMDGPEAFAYLVSQRIANRVWREVMGYSLTLVHYVPRNEEQRDLLLQLTNSFVGSAWSLKSLLADVVTHPLYNDTAPEDGCGADGPYFMPRVFNPWTLLDPVEEQLNSPGDIVHRYDARLLLYMIAEAMDWPDPSQFPGAENEAFQKAIGVFVKDAEPGFDGVDFQGLLSYEARHGACENPTFQPDWIDLFAILAGADATATVSDAAAAMKNRLLSQPDLEPAEAALVADLFGATGPDALLSDIANWQTGLRRYCGALLQTPQFLLTGLAPPEQTTTPKLQIPEETFPSRCEAWAGLLDPGKWNVVCTPADLVVTPFAPALGTVADPPVSAGATCGDGTCDPDEDATSCVIDCGGNDATVCMRDRCDSDILACLDDDGCSGLFECLLGCTEDACAQQCFLAATGDDAGVALMSAALSCGQANSCFVACGNGLCADDEDVAGCPQDCSLPCIQSACTSQLAVCDDVAGCPELVACWAPCTTYDCQTACIQTAPPAAIAALETVSTCAAASSCVADTSCGDGTCDAATEDETTCPEDCVTGPVCGNDVCETGENPGNCPQDCQGPAASCENNCGNYSAQQPCQCDAQCDQFNDCCPDIFQFCGQDFCGDGQCTGNETEASCPAECTSTCPNGTCDPGEDSTNCPADCPAGPQCGDGTCDEGSEDPLSCAADCMLPCLQDNCSGALGNCAGQLGCFSAIPCLGGCAGDATCAAACADAGAPADQKAVNDLVNCGTTAACFQ